MITLWAYEHCDLVLQGSIISTSSVVSTCTFMMLLMEAYELCVHATRSTSIVSFLYPDSVTENG